MPVTKPTLYPDWATDDVTNPQSHKANVVEPDLTHKTVGWDFKEFPPRQFFNWLGRITNNWIQWFDQDIARVDAALEETSAVGGSFPVTITGVSNAPSATARYTVDEHLYTVHLHLPFLEGVPTPSTNAIGIVPNDGAQWPAAILDSHTSLVPCIVRSGGLDKPGTLQLPNNDTTPMYLTVFNGTSFDDS